MDARTRRVDIIINARSGTPDKQAAAAHAAQYLSSRGMDVRLELIRSPDALPGAAARAAAGDADIVVAGGGDGTIATVAGALVDTPKVLGLLPLGTFNYFARRLDVPLEPDEALAVIAAATTIKAVSVGDVNGRTFLNNSSIGLYPAVLKQREGAYRRFGRSQAAAYLSVAFVLMRPPGFLTLEITADGTPLERKTPLLFVGLNPHQLEAFGIPGYECADAGRFAMYVTRPLAPWQLWRLGLRGFFGGLHGSRDVEVICASELLVGIRRQRVRVAIDGEVVRLRSPLRFQFRENALRVLTP
jgi:diacylglycerol kinase family enzyme